MFKVLEVVETKIKDEMTMAKGAVIYDGWTHISTHYVGEFAVYKHTVAVFKNGVMSTESELGIYFWSPLIEVRPPI